MGHVERKVLCIRICLSLLWFRVLLNPVRLISLLTTPPPESGKSLIPNKGTLVPSYSDTLQEDNGIAVLLHSGPPHLNNSTINFSGESVLEGTDSDNRTGIRPLLLVPLGVQ